MVVGRVRQVQLPEDRGDVRLDRPLGEDEPLGDGVVRQALRDQAKHLALARGEGSQGVMPSTTAQEPRHDRGIDDRLAIDDAAERIDDDRGVDHPFLEQVADALGVLRDESESPRRFDVLRQDEDTHVREGVADAAGVDVAVRIDLDVDTASVPTRIADLIAAAGGGVTLAAPADLAGTSLRIRLPCA